MISTASKITTSDDPPTPTPDDVRMARASVRLTYTAASDLETDEDTRRSAIALIDAWTSDSSDACASFDDEPDTVVITDPDATPRLTPEDIAAEVARRRADQYLPGRDSLVALADLVVDWIAAVRAHEAAQQTATRSGRRCGTDETETTSKRLDTMERALVMAVAR
jgi:hypothetical protein